MIEKHFASNKKSHPFDISPQSLLTINRFDLGFKIALIDMFKNTSKDLWNKDERYIAYNEHIFAITEGNYAELSSSKTGIDDYVESFYETYVNLSLNDFDATLGYLPLTERGTILNGAHRVSSLISMNKNAKAVTVYGEDELKYDYHYFKGFGISMGSMDISAREILNSSDDMYIACIWPASMEKISEIDDVLERHTFYKKSLSFTEVGKVNLMLHLYPNESWIGSVEDDFSGLSGKIGPCFRNKNEVSFYFLKSGSLDEVLLLKDRVRSIVNEGKHAIHITDNTIESRLIGNYILSDDGLKAGNHVKVWTSNNFKSIFPPLEVNVNNRKFNLINDENLDNKLDDFYYSMNYMGSNYISIECLYRNKYISKKQVESLNGNGSLRDFINKLFSKRYVKTIIKSRIKRSKAFPIIRWVKEKYSENIKK